MPKYDISIIVTIYNKEGFLPYTIESILAQKKDCSLNFEFIFIDDASTDRSVELIEKLTENTDNVTIIKNTTNRGPSIRTNEAAAKANGKYLHIIDGDDIMPKNCSKTLFDLLEKESADVIYGKFKKTHQDASQLLEYKMDKEELDYRTSDDPLKFVMGKGFVRMTLMTKKSTYIKAQGCDERIFIQDESLPLRLATTADKFIKLNHVVIYVPEITEDNLSKNSAQQHHDKFFACYNLFQDKPLETKKVERELFQKMIACYWKHIKNKNMLPYLSGAFFLYLYSKAFKPKFYQELADYLAKEFGKIKNIRRSH